MSMPSKPNVPEINPGQSELWLPRVANPYASVWWTTQTVNQVPESIMGWLVAQGYEVTGITQDNTTVPPTNYFALTREGMTPQQLLLSLCNQYTIAANEARTANQVRYNEIVANWTQMIDSSHTQFDAQTSVQNAQAGFYLADLDSYMDAIDTLINDNQAQIVIDANSARDALGIFDGRLTDLETNASNSAITITSLLSTQQTNLQTFINDYNAKLAELDANYTAHLGSVLAEIASLDTVTDAHIADYQSQFVTLASNYTAHLSTIDGLISSITSNVNTYVADVTEILNGIEGDYNDVEVDLTAIKTSAGTLGNQMESDYNDILDLLISEYTVHAGLARGFLTDLGATELARITEQFAASLSAQIQQLTSRGLAAAAIVADVTARNQRDRDEQIQALNDRLNREKLENQHRLYAQQVAMRGQTLEGVVRINAVQQEVLRYQASLVTGTYSLLQETRNRVLAGKQAIFAARDANHKFGVELRTNLYGQLQDVRQRTIESTDRIYRVRDVLAKWTNSETNRQYEQLQQVEAQYVAAIDRINANRQQVTSAEISQRDQLLQQLQTALNGLLSGKERYAAVLMQIAGTLADHKHRAIAERMSTAVNRLEGWKSVAEQNRSLMALQLDERNKLLIGLYSFVERRDDPAPPFADLSQMIAGLGGWVSS